MNSPKQGPNASSRAYFTESKKGEVNELKALMRNINVERDGKRKRDIIKKVIAYMTLGLDVSRLFTEMVMAVETRDIVVKKMVYFYLGNYAQTNPEMALMCCNTLNRDCDDEDPMVRGLALRSLTGIRLAEMAEYMVEPIKRGMQDVSPYVRKTAVMAIVKLYGISSDLAEPIVATLDDMLNDVDTSVVTNVIYVLQELNRFTLTRDLIMVLLNRIHEFNEHGLTLVLSLLAKYSPTSDEELYSIMNLLDPILRTTHSGNVLATVHTFFQLTRHKENKDEFRLRILDRVKSPIMALFAGGSHETNYALLRHLQVLVTMNPTVFAHDFREFFVRYNEPSFIKYEKLKILPQLVTEENIGDIVEELEVYVSDVDLELSKRSIRALGQVVPRCPTFSHIVFEKITRLLQFDIDHVKHEAILTLIQAIRKLPSLRYLFVPHVAFCLKKNEDIPSKAALVWFIGEYGNFHPSSSSSSGLGKEPEEGEGGEEKVMEVVDAPYLLETLIDKYEAQAPEVKLQLLSATLKLFFVRAPEVQAMLGRLLAEAIEEDAANQAVRDRALLYYRLLLQGPEVASAVLSPVHITAGSGNNDVTLATFAEEKNQALRRVIFDQFNSLSVVYGKAASSFTPPECLEEDEQTEEKDMFGLGGETHQQQQQQQRQHESVNLLAVHDDDEEEEQHHYHHQQDHHQDQGSIFSSSSSPPLFSLSGPPLSSSEFQAKWKQINPPFTSSLTSSSFPTPDTIPQHLESNGLKVVASGQLPTLVKMFCYTYVESSTNSTASSSSTSLLDFGLEDTTTTTQDVVLLLVEAGREGGQVNITLKTEATNKETILNEVRRLVG
jgi:vesicle coat complex subunit